MKHFATLFLLIGLSLLANAQQNCTYTDLGSAATYSLSTGEVLCIESGVFTGQISSFTTGAEIRVAKGAVFQPSVLVNAEGLISNKGTVKLEVASQPGYNFSVVNDSGALFQWLVPQNFTMPVSIVNHRDAEMDFFTAFQLPGGSDLLNEGMLVVKNELTVHNNALLSNEGLIYVWGNLAVSGILFNAGLMKVAGFTNINSDAFFTNKCSFYGKNTWTNESMQTENYGYIDIYGNDAANCKFINNAHFLNDVKGIVQATDFDNHMQISGSGTFTIAQLSRNYGSFGADGGGINFYDMTPSAGQIFDVETVPPHLSVSAAVTGMYDTNYISENCNQMAFPDFINTPLPVLLSTLQVIAPDCIPQIIWKTVQERNSAYFELQRKASSEQQFSTISTITAAGDADAEISYAYTDERLANDNYQYRLKMVDKDGRFAYSRVSSVQLSCGGAASTAVYPNPAIDQLKVSLNANADDTYMLSIYDVTGRRVFNSSYNFSSGLQVINIPVAQWHQGYYTLLLTNNIKTESFKFLKN